MTADASGFSHVVRAVLGEAAFVRGEQAVDRCQGSCYLLNVSGSLARHAKTSSDSNDHLSALFF